MNGEQKVIEEIAKGKRLRKSSFLSEERVDVNKDDLASIIDEVSAERCKEVILSMKREMSIEQSEEELLFIYTPLDLLPIMKEIIKK